MGQKLYKKYMDMCILYGVRSYSTDFEERSTAHLQIRISDSDPSKMMIFF